MAHFAPNAQTAKQLLEIFTEQINNTHTREAYLRATSDIASWHGAYGIDDPGQRPVHVAAYVEGLRSTIAMP